MPTAETILTSEFFYQFALNYDMDPGGSNLMTFLIEHQQHLAKYVVVNYKGLGFMEELNPMETIFNANYAFMLIGDAVKRIYDALTADYDPLENYFTDRKMGTTTDNTDVRTGGVSKTIGGSIGSTRTGSRDREYNEHTNVGQATTFESFTTDNDFKNVSKNTESGKITDTYNAFGSTTTYNGYNENTQYNQLQDKHDGQEDIEEHRSGNSGIFSKQDLTQRELTLRQNNLFVNTFVRMLVGAFNVGVWQ